MSMWLFGAAKLLLAVQSTQAAIVGSVRDGETGEPVTGAVVSLPNAGRAVVSDASGRYAIRSVAPGPERLGVRRIGYAQRTLHVLVPRRGEIEINIDLRRDPLMLRPVEIRPSVAVGEMDANRRPESSDRGLSIDAVRNHPLLEEPDVFVALGGGEVAMHPESPSGVHIRGGASDQTAYLLDGIPVFSPYHSAGTFSAWNPDALERLDLTHAPLATALPDALSGTVAGTTRGPGARFAAQGSLSTTQARLTLSGPVGARGGGYLVSVRSGFPGFIVPERDASYLRGESGDLLAKAEAPVFGGRGRVLVYDNTNETGTAADVTSGSPGSANDEQHGHAFEWRSRSLGGEWSRAIGPVATRLQAWSASGTTDARWAVGGDSALGLAANRRDVGVVATVEHRTDETTTLAALRVRDSRTSYRVGSGDAPTPTLALDASTPVASLFIRHQRLVVDHLTANVALSVTAATGTTFLGPQALLRWRPSPMLTVTGSYARSHQFAQSLRNGESIIGMVFPADLFVGANTPGVPVASADNGSLVAELRPLEAVRVEARTYLRNSRGLVLVAPSSGEPFASDGFTTGASASRGFSLDASVSAPRHALMASYGWQRVRVAYGDTRYAPNHAAAHQLDGGVIVFPSPTFSVRVGASAALGRRTSGLTGTFESEGCNLLDRGCELAGTPRVSAGQLGATRLPPYLTIDAGVRKRWEVEVAGRDADLSVFTAVTNVLGRRNLLSFIDDPSNADRREIWMRSLAPLVVGIDARF